MSDHYSSNLESENPDFELTERLIMDESSQAPKRKCFIGSENVLLIFTVIAVILGVIIGVILWDPNVHWSDRQLSYLGFPGDMFVRMLKMLILPLIMSSIISSLASLESSTAGRLGLCAMVYYFSTTMIAVTTGIILVVAISPGTLNKQTQTVTGAEEQDKCISNALDTVLDLIRNMFPDNLIEATIKTQKICMKFVNATGNVTEIVPVNEALDLSEADRSTLEFVPDPRKNDGMNILGLVTFSVGLGIVLSVLGPEGKPLRDFFKCMERASMMLISLVIWYSPIGITFLIARQIVEMDDPGKELERLGGYMATVLTGLFIHGFIVLPAMLIILARRNPFKFVYGMLQALLTAFATSSSSATLPLSIKCLEENNDIDPRVARFVLPLGATINMDGTALYEAVAAIYIAQTQGKILSLGEVILVSLTATLASIGAAGIPQAGIVTMIMVLIAIGMPSNLFVLIIPVDFMLDRIRTTVNVHGDSIGAAVVQKLCGRHLEQADRQKAEEEADDEMHMELLKHH